MIDHPIVVIGTVVLVSMSMIGMAAATPGDGPPEDLPDVVPDFVGDLLNAISEFIGSVLNGVANLVGSLVPDGATSHIGIVG